MKIINDFRCGDGHTTEHFVESDTQVVRCACGLDATKVVTTVHATFNATGKFATTKAKMRWAKQREQKIAEERKINAE